MNYWSSRQYKSRFARNVLLSARKLATECCRILYEFAAIILPILIIIVIQGPIVHILHKILITNLFGF